jgi:hypothetical protein
MFWKCSGLKIQYHEKKYNYKFNTVAKIFKAYIITLLYRVLLAKMAILIFH